MCETQNMSGKRKNSPIKIEDIFNQNVTNSRRMEESIGEVKEMVKKLTINQYELNSKVSEIECDMRHVRERQVINDSRINSLEQREINRVMEIKGISSEELCKVKDVKKFVVELCGNLNAHCESDAIEKAYMRKIVTKEKEKSFAIIIVKFWSEDVKKDVMKRKFANDKGKKPELYFDHSLTAYNRALLTKSLSVREKLKTPIVFVRDGKIHLKESRSGKSLIVRSFEDLDALLDTKSTKSSTSNQS